MFRGAERGQLAKVNGKRVSNTLNIGAQTPRIRKDLVQFPLKLTERVSLNAVGAESSSTYTAKDFR